MFREAIARTDAAGNLVVAMIDVMGKGVPASLLAAMLRSSLRALAAVESSPSWSPDGGEIVYSSDERGGPQLFRISSGGGSEVRSRMSAL